MKIGVTITKLWDDNTRLVFKRLYNLHNYINFSFIEGVNRPNCEAIAKQFKMYCIGSLFYKDHDFEDQILEACELSGKNSTLANPCIRPLNMFMSEVDHEKYPDVKQKYRFEKVKE